MGAVDVMGILWDVMLLNIHGTPMEYSWDILLPTQSLENNGNIYGKITL